MWVFGVLCGLCIGSSRPPLFPFPRTVELFQAWWTINFSHSDLAAYWENLAGIPIITPGARAALFHFLQSLMLIIKRLSANEGDEGHEGHVCFFHILEGHEGVKAMNPMKKLKVLLFILLGPES